MDGRTAVAENEYQPGARFHDLDELNHAVSGSNLEFVQLKSGNIDIALDQVALGELSIDLGKVNVPLRVMGELDPRRFSIGLFPGGANATWNGNSVDASKLLLCPPGSELNGYLSTNYGWTSLVTPPEWINAIEKTTSRTNLAQARSCMAIKTNPEKLADLRQAIASIVRPADIPRDTLANDWLITDVRNALGAALSSIDAPRTKVVSQISGHFILAKRAECYMRERIIEPISVDDMCVAMRVSRRYLEYAFANACGTSPSRYLRLLRLHHVRRHLKASGGRTTVTNEAFRVGFNHLSLFATQYKNAFGECPSVTLARATTKPPVSCPRPDRFAADPDPCGFTIAKQFPSALVSKLT